MLQKQHSWIEFCWPWWTSALYTEAPFIADWTISACTSYKAERLEGLFCCTTTFMMKETFPFYFPEQATYNHPSKLGVSTPRDCIVKEVKQGVQLAKLEAMVNIIKQNFISTKNLTHNRIIPKPPSKWFWKFVKKNDFQADNLALKSVLSSCFCSANNDKII